MDVIVIGGGPGGYVAAIWAAKGGAKVTLVEKDALGGTCLNRGCIPTKAILHAADQYAKLKELPKLGIDAGEARVDFGRVMANKDGVVRKLTGGVAMLLKKNGVRVITAEARFADPHTVQAGGERLHADAVVIAAGSSPADLPFARVDGARVINSDHALGLTRLPQSLAIIGGGVIGCEFAQAFARLGTKITMLEVLPRLAATMDEEQSALLAKVLRREGVRVELGCRVESLAPGEAGMTVSYRDAAGDAACVTAEKVLVAAGRRSAAGALALDQAGIAVNKRGYIPVDAHMRTNQPHIYAIGDITGGVQLAHVASAQGVAAARNILGEDYEMDAACIPQCIYTSPEIASFGPSEAKAKELYGDITTGRFAMAGNGRAMIEGETDGFAKVVLEKRNQVVRGVHLAGPNVTEMISGMAGLVGFEATLADAETWMFAHPSVSEAIHESLLDARGMAIHQ